MDVSLSGIRILLGSIAVLSFTLASCGNRYDLSTERGRRSRIDDANFHLSSGNCAGAAEAINPIYDSPYVDDEIRVLKAAAFACHARYRMLTFIANMTGVSNYFQGMAKSLDNATNDAARSFMYQAVDVLTRSNTVLSADQRSRSVNSFMVFLQFGVISSILRNYGQPDCCNGIQGATLVYETAAANPAGEMSNEDACALGAAFSFISDSYNHSDLSDSDSQSAVAGMNSVCTSAGLSSCAVLSRLRSACDGTNAASVAAASVVGVVNTSW